MFNRTAPKISRGMSWPSSGHGIGLAIVWSSVRQLNRYIFWCLDVVKRKIIFSNKIISRWSVKLIILQVGSFSVFCIISSCVLWHTHTRSTRTPALLSPRRASCVGDGCCLLAQSPDHPTIPPHHPYWSVGQILVAWPRMLRSSRASGASACSPCAAGTYGGTSGDGGGGVSIGGGGGFSLSRAEAGLILFQLQGLGTGRRRVGMNGWSARAVQHSGHLLLLWRWFHNSSSYAGLWLSCGIWFKQMPAECI